MMDAAEGEGRVDAKEGAGMMDAAEEKGRMEKKEPAGEFGRKVAADEHDGPKNGDPHPLVSVIIPVLNNLSGIERCIGALQNQSWPADRMEVIVVDNGSSDGTWESLQARQETYRQSGMRLCLLRADKAFTPYVARNRGLEKATGQIIAFTDSTCIPEPKWIENGVRELQRQNADLLGGHVRFIYSDPKNAAERYDSLLNVEVKHNVARRGVAKTGNLFVRREIFDRVGRFDETVRSGGDVEWTGRASRMGCRIVYGADAVVGYEARRLIPLLKKFYRVGKGQPAIWVREEGLGTGKMLWRILYDLRPVLPGFIHSMIEYREQKDVPNSIFSLMMVGWLCRITNGAGRLAGMARLRKIKPRETITRR